MNATDSPTITDISSTSASLIGTTTKNITITGTNLADTNGFADVALIDSVTKKVTVLTPTITNDTELIFEVTTDVVCGKYFVVVRN